MAIPNYVLTVNQGPGGFSCEWSWTQGAPLCHYLQKSINNGGVWLTIYTVNSPSAPESYTDTFIEDNILYSYRVIDESNFMSNIVDRVLWDMSFKDNVWVSESSSVSAIHNPTATGFSTSDVVTVTESNENWVGDYYSFEARDNVRVSETFTAVRRNYDESFSDNVYVSELANFSVVQTPVFVYYLGSKDGNVYVYSDDYLSDDGRIENPFWESKDYDFSDQQPATADRWKSIERVKLEYVDHGQITVGVGVSIDSGESWDISTKTFGNGDGAVKSVSFDFRESGRYFRFLIRLYSGEAPFQFTRLTIMFSVGGRWFEV